MTAADLAAVAEVFALAFPDKLAGMLPGRVPASAMLLAHAALGSRDAWVIGDSTVDGLSRSRTAAAAGSITSTGVSSGGTSRSPLRLVQRCSS